MNANICMSMMDEKFLRRYNQQQRKELQRVYDEIKWYLGEELHRDPSKAPEDKKMVELRLADVILNGFGRYLSSLTLCTLDQQDPSQSLTLTSSSYSSSKVA